MSGRQESLRQDVAYVIGRTNRTGHVYIDGQDACLLIADALIEAGLIAEPFDTVAELRDIADQGAARARGERA